MSVVYIDHQKKEGEAEPSDKIENRVPNRGTCENGSLFNLHTSLTYCVLLHKAMKNCLQNDLLYYQSHGTSVQSYQ